MALYRGDARVFKACINTEGMIAMRLYTSYFYQIRNFFPYMIPISTAISDPLWFRPDKGQEFYTDKKGVANGLRYEPLIVQRYCEPVCPCEAKDSTQCSFIQEYQELLATVDIDATIKAFEHCKEYMKKKLNLEQEPVIVLIVYETPQNKCSERAALQEFFTSRGHLCTELEYPIRKENML